jgi:DNA-binding transcriptional ArsR family regulator
MEPSSFVVVMGNTAFVRVVDFLLENRPFDYSKTEIAKNAGVGWSTLHGIWKVLGGADIVRQTRTVGKSKMYRLNEENPVVRKLIELDADITELFAHKLAAPLPIRVRSAKTSPPLILPPT